MNDNAGAFVEIDHAKLGREGMFLLGAREAIDRWIVRLMTLSQTQPNGGVAQVMVEIAEEMTKDRDGVSVALTKIAVKEKSGVVNHIRTDEEH
jgi:hypothetical protein